MAEGLLHGSIGAFSSSRSWDETLQSLRWQRPQGHQALNLLMININAIVTVVDGKASLAFGTSAPCATIMTYYDRNVHDITHPFMQINNPGGKPLYLSARRKALLPRTDPLPSQPPQMQPLATLPLPHHVRVQNNPLLLIRRARPRPLRSFTRRCLSPSSRVSSRNVE